MSLGFAISWLTFGQALGKSESQQPVCSPPPEAFVEALGSGSPKAQRHSCCPWHLGFKASWLPKADLLTFWFLLFGLVLVMAPKCEPFISGPFGQVRPVSCSKPRLCFFWLTTFGPLWVMERPLCLSAKNNTSCEGKCHDSQAPLNLRHAHILLWQT